MISIHKMIALTGCMGLWILVGCNKTESTPQPPATIKPVEVKLTKTVRQKLLRTISQPAQVLPFEEAIIHSKVTGHVLSVLVDIGDKVKGPILDGSGKITTPGSPLLKVEVPELVEDLNQRKAMEKLAIDEVALKKNIEAVSKAVIESAQAGLQEAKAGVTRSSANLERWKSENDRIARLVSGKVLDEQTLDEVSNQMKAAQSSQEETAARVKQAQAKLDRSVAELEQARSETRVAESKVQVARAEIRKMEAMVGFTRLDAPFDGIVTSRKVDPGKLVHADSANRAEPLFTITKMDLVRIVMDVPELDSPLVREGAEARIGLPALPGREITAKVTRISWALDRSTRNLRAEIDIPNADLALRPGMFANARILVNLPEAVVLPTSALVRSPDGAFAFVVEDGKARRVDVKLGRIEGDLAEVTGIRTDLKDSAWQPVPTDMDFIASGVATLAPGLPVLISAPTSK